jgi:hypothetical protein
MGFHTLAGVVLAFALLGCVRSGPAPADQIRTARLCVPPDRWPAVIETMRSFGARNGLRVAEGLEGENTTGLNVALVRGHHLLSEDQLDLWVTSDPLKASASLNVSLLTRRRITGEDVKVVQALLATLKPLGC